MVSGAFDRSRTSGGYFLGAQKSIPAAGTVASGDDKYIDSNIYVLVGVKTGLTLLLFQPMIIFHKIGKGFRCINRIITNIEH